MNTATEIDAPEIQPIYWFALLERAIHCGDHESAAHAQRELANLGVKVRYGRPPPRRQTAGSRR